MTTNLETKAFGVLEIKDDTKGEVVAVVATLGVVDNDKDVILPGAIPNGSRVKLSAYGHGLKYGEPPAGIGTMFEENGKAMFQGKYFLTTDLGQQAFNTVKEMGPESEWSFGYLTSEVKTAPMTAEWKEKGARRLIAKLNPIEVSPVFLGAGIETTTVSVKELVKEAVKEADQEAEQARVEEEGRQKAEEEAEAKRVGEEAAAEAARVEAEKKAAEEADAEKETKRLADEAAEAETKRLAEEAATKARAVIDREEYERVQRSLRRMGLR